MVWVFLAVAWFAGGDVRTHTEVFPTQLACEQFGAEFQQMVAAKDTHTGIISAMAQCVPVSNPATEKHAAE